LSINQALHKYDFILEEICGNFECRSRRQDGATDIEDMEKLPAHEVIYRQIRDKILFGELEPGQSVTIQGFVDELGGSMTPVREAIRRLTAEGALKFQGNRRVCVPAIGEKQFSEISFARLTLEPKLAVMGAKNIVKSDIEALRAIDTELDKAIERGDVGGYMHQNFKFHFTLYNLSNSDILQPLAETLWLRHGPLARIICGKYGTSNLVDRHKEVLTGLEAGDPQAVGEAMSSDIEQGVDIVLGSLGWKII
jgi:DNA-binding GntR family transcriptional regulator